jgi:DNA-binding MarR family transcriptional regulator
MFTSPTSPNKQAVENLAKRYPNLEISSVEACLAFLQAAAEIYDAMDTHFARYGLSMGKFTMLMQLLQAEKYRLAPSECAERAGVTRGTITGLLDGLERDGWVKRQPHESDRRRLMIQLTEEGRMKLDEMLPDHFCRTGKLMAHFTDPEKKALIKLLAKLRAGASAMKEAVFSKHWIMFFIPAFTIFPSPSTIFTVGFILYPRK